MLIWEENQWASKSADKRKVKVKLKTLVQVTSRANKPAPRGGKLVEVNEEETGANQRKRQGVIK